MSESSSSSSLGRSGLVSFSNDDSNVLGVPNQKRQSEAGYYIEEEIDEEEETFRSSPFVDRSAQLRATLNSLALMNVGSVINKKKLPLPDFGPKF